MHSLLWLVVLAGQVALNTNPQTGSTTEILETRLPAYSATITQASEKGLSIKVASQPKTIPLDQLLRVKFPGAAVNPQPDALQVELADGSQLRCQQITYDGKLVQLHIKDDWKISLPTNQINSCLTQPLDAALAKQWENMASSRIAGDLLILLRSADTLDKIEGLINEINETQVKFEFEGQAIPVQRAKLAGWRFFSTNKEQPGKLLAVLRDTCGNNWMIQSLTAQAWSATGKAQLKLVGGTTIDLPIENISEIDFSFGSMRFLADLEPLERKVQPRLSFAVKIPEAEVLFGPRPSPPESTRGATAGPGLQFMGSGSIVYRVPNDFKHLQGSVALTPDGPQFVACKAQVFVEDKVVWEKTLSEPQEAQPIELDVEPGKRVRLVVESESKQPVGDLVTWRQLRFVK